MSKIAATKAELLAAEIMAEHELVSIVRQACDASGLDRQEIADRLGIHRSGISKLLNRPRNMTIRMAARVLRATGYRLRLRTMRVEMLAEQRPTTGTTSTAANNVVLFDESSCSVRRLSDRAAA